MTSVVTLPTVYQEFIALSRYARFDNTLGRREKWHETVQRLIDFWRKQLPQLSAETLERIQHAILHLDVMPSMRSLMTAGPAAERDNVAMYNCSASAITGTGPTISVWNDSMKDMGFDEPLTIALRTPIVFDEMLYILLCGTGVGFSVERQFISEMPTVGRALSRSIYKRTQKNYPGVPKQELSYFDKKQNTIYVADSKYGWASALRILIVELYNGNFTVKYDISEIRPAGAVLKTFGGRASGPSALIKMFEDVRAIFSQASGRKLNSIECHDIMCHIASAVVVGGVRRAALISMSNLSDERMRYAKSGEWWNDNPQRALANNSVAYTEKPAMGAFMREWQALYESKSGERGVFNREAAKKYAAESGRDPNHEFISNPCCEISLRETGQMCNLSSVVVRPEDTLDTLMDKVEIATILGTMQATATNFVYLSPRWKSNCDDERLLGVSMSGAMDHPLLQSFSTDAEEWLSALSQHAKLINAQYAAMFGINKAAAITCVKPEGTSSQLNDTASGLHPRYAPYYIRRVRADSKDPLAQVMREQDFPCEEDVMQPTNLVFSFPIKAPEHAVFRDDRTAIEQLEYWLMWKKYWCDSHNPSVTIYVKEHEWFAVGAWVYENFDDVCGLSFLPHSDHSYQQAPYEECSEHEYEQLAAVMPSEINYEALRLLETSDRTTGTQEYACSAGGCELV
jgi:ribonucleoside-triphosphate reductase (thioredoxin)